jgi:hypothetical protein
MSLRYYDVLEETLKSLDEWRASRTTSKDDVIDAIRERILMLMTHVITTPLIGTAYAYPGDIKTLEEWASPAAQPG